MLRDAKAKIDLLATAACCGQSTTNGFSQLLKKQTEPSACSPKLLSVSFH